jgi:hypothetical protein
MKNIRENKYAEHIDLSMFDITLDTEQRYEEYAKLAAKKNQREK